MDPVSTTLAVITFATAVKDLVELAQNICDAFAKVPQNYKKAKELAMYILKILKEMEAWDSNKNKEILDSAEVLKTSFQELRQEMTLVHDKCSQLIPPRSVRIQDKFKIAFYSFWNRSKVEDLVLGLTSHVENSYKIFLLLSQIRTEATVNQISQVVNTGTIVRVQSYSMDGYQGNFINMPRLSDARLFQCFQPYSTSMMRIDETISETDLYKAVLRQELGKIKKSLGHLTSRLLEDQPWQISEVPPLVSTWRLYLPPVSDTTAHQSLLIDAFKIQSLIDSANLFRINSAIDFFSGNLRDMGLLEDCLTINLWRVDFWKKIVLMSPTNSLNAWAHLAHSLTGASISSHDIGDRDEAYAKSQEAMEIIQAKLDCSLSTEVQYLLARNLCIQAKTTHTPALINCIELATKAVLTMEATLSLHNLHREQLSIYPLPMPSSTDSNSMNSSTLKADDTDSKLDSSSLHDSLYSYSTILLDLSYIQEIEGYISEAHATKKRALVILQSLLLKYPNSEQLLAETASVMLQICSSNFHSINSLADNLEYAKEGTNIYRKLLQTSFPTYIIGLLDQLQSYSQILCSAGMVQDSDKIFKEMTALSELVSQRYQDLQLPSEIDADYQFRLASILYYENRSSEGIYAAHNAAEQYSALAFLDTNRSPLKLIRALIILCKMLCKTNQQQSAIIEGFKVLRLIDNTVETDKEIQKFADSREHLSLIDFLMGVLEDLSPDPSSFGKASILATRFKKLFLSLDRFDFKSCTPGMYMEVLVKNGLVDNAINYGQDFLSTWERKYSYSDTCKSAYSYLYCMEKHIDSLKKHNRTHDALTYSTNMMAIVQPHSQHHKDPSIRKLQYILSKTHVELLCSVGLYKAALEFTQAAAIKSNSNEGPSIDVYNHCVLHELVDLALMQLYNFLPLEAIETASQAESLSRLEISKSANTENPCFFAVLYYSAYIISNALFDVAHISQALVYSMEMKDGLQDRVHPELQSSIDKGNCLVSATIAHIYFVQSNYTQAKQLMVKVLDMDRKLFKEEKSQFVQLAFDLLFAGIAFCCVNEHEAGVALLTELEDLQQKLFVTHPALAHEVEFNLEMQAQRGQWELIQTAARAKLTCNHADQALNLKMSCSDNRSRLEAVEE